MKDGIDSERLLSWLGGGALAALLLFGAVLLTGSLRSPDSAEQPQSGFAWMMSGPGGGAASACPMMGPARGTSGGRSGTAAESGGNSDDGDAEEPDVSYQLSTELAQGQFRFVGDGGDIDGEVNPVLTVRESELVEVTLNNVDGYPHDFVAEELGVASDRIDNAGDSVTVRFRVEEPGTYSYFCSFPGHRQAGMEGELKVTERDD